MLKEALQYIVGHATESQALPETFIPTKALPADVAIKSLERYLDVPIFHRAAFSTVRLTDFIRYLEGESMDTQTAVFIDPNADGALAIVDMGTHNMPGCGYHQAKLAMCKTPEFVALEAACEDDMSQRQMLEFLEDHAHCITPWIRKTGKGEAEAASVAQAIQIVRNIETKAHAERRHEHGDYANTSEGMESIEMQGRDGQQVVSLAFECSPYEDTEPRTIDVRLGMSTEGSKPALKLRIVAADAIKRDVQAEIENRVRGEADIGDVRIFVGDIRHQQ